MRLAVALVVAAVVAPAVAPGAPGEVVRVEHHDPTGLPSRGSPSALVTVELFFTPGASSRTATYRMVEQLQATHPTRIHLVYRVLKGNGQARLPYAALEAHAQGKFFEFLDAVNHSTQMLTDAVLLQIAKSSGLDVERFTAAITKPPAGYDQVLDANQRRMRLRARTGSQPAVLFNGRPPTVQQSSSQLGTSDLEREYFASKDLAEDLLDRGADPHALADAFDAQTRIDPLQIVVPVGQPDDTVDDVPAVPPLATPPLDLHGMPSLGRSDAAVTIAVLCNPTSTNCAQAMRTARIAQDLYADSVRVVWAPFFDVTRENAADLALLSDAALCAEKVGTSAEIDFESPSSPGWRWVESMLTDASLRHNRGAPDRLLEDVTDKLRVDRRAFATCRARLAGTALAWIEAARHAGARTSPSTVVGGRIHPSIVNPDALQQLVEAELTPGPCEGCLHLDDYAPAWRTGVISSKR